MDKNTASSPFLSHHSTIVVDGVQWFSMPEASKKLRVSNTYIKVKMGEFKNEPLFLDILNNPLCHKQVFRRMHRDKPTYRHWFTARGISELRRYFVRFCGISRKRYPKGFDEELLSKSYSVPGATFSNNTTRSKPSPTEVQLSLESDLKDTPTPLPLVQLEPLRKKLKDALKKLDEFEKLYSSLSSDLL